VLYRNDGICLKRLADTQQVLNFTLSSFSIAKVPARFGILFLSVLVVMKKFGLFIGIDRYRNFDEKNQLHCAGEDARALAEAFSKMLGFTTEVLLDTHLGYDDNASHEVIFHQLEAWRAQLDPDDETLLLLYFAGHGTVVNGEQYLLAPKAAQTALDRPTKRGAIGIIQSKALHDATEDWPNAKRVFVFDACRVDINRRDDNSVSMGTRSIFGRKRDDDATVTTLRSCTPDQVAFELRNYQVGDVKKSHGLYTAALLDVLEKRTHNEINFTLDENFNTDIRNAMRDLVSQHAPKEFVAHAQQQRPVRDGAALCLANAADMRAIKIAKLLHQFEAHFQAGYFDAPLSGCCNETVHDLKRLNHAPHEIEHLIKRIDAARQQREQEKRCLRGEKLLETARTLGTAEAYRRVLEEGFTEYKQEVDEFLSEWLSEREEAQWHRLRQKPTLIALRNFLKQFPVGLHVGEAQELLAQLEQEAAIRQEASEWQLVQNGTLAELQVFIQRWPQGAHFAAARQAILWHEDEACWLHANALRTETAILAYLKLYPQPRFARQAQALLQELAHEEQIRQQKNARQADERLWASTDDAACKGHDDAASIALFEALLPRLKTDFVKTRCQNRIAQLSVAQKKREQDAAAAAAAMAPDEAACWQAAKTTRTVEMIEAYLAKYPQGQFLQQAQELLSALAEEQQKQTQRLIRQADEKLWAAADENYARRDALSLLIALLPKLQTEIVRNRCRERIAQLEKNFRAVAQELPPQPPSGPGSAPS
jgi:hypothetical protein